MKRPTDKAITDYLRHVGLGTPMRQIARQNGTYDWPVRKRIIRVEEAREDPKFDHEMVTLLNGVSKLRGIYE